MSLCKSRVLFGILLVGGEWGGVRRASEGLDPGRPEFLAEGYVNDPLMVLPRFWDQDAAAHLDAVRQIGKQAAEEAQKNRAVELEYYDIVCKPEFGEIPGLNP